MASPNEDTYQHVRKEAEKILQKRLDYNLAVQQVKNFAGPDDTAPNWFALAKVGAAIASMRLLPDDMVAHRQFYWRTIIDKSVDPPVAYMLIPNDDFMSAI
ncbi:hypothetical protein HYP93_gp85 [Stenotrophomonas phage Pokken]|uniref:Uncharacterized protein n=1 Tax=Stenotrophomonas phage Pokken TaxID=2596674 RepID=A0A5B9N9V7_9CAUD|nr:hypothetical protein HYP93_gp85 [Stenotrophomonas phage Pokken]QEG09272.1 hypothetical protein CPT_Pokken_054 [Stenotrophomonas phage Pokken]